MLKLLSTNMDIIYILNMLIFFIVNSIILINF